MNGTLDVSGNTDIDGTLDAQGATNLQSTLTVADFADLNDSLDVAMDASFQSTVHIQDSLVVNGDSDMNGTLDVDGDTEMDTVNIDGSLTVAQFADFNDSLDVAKSVNIQDNLDVNDSLVVNSAGNVGQVFAVENVHGVSSTYVEVYTTNTAGTESSSRLTTPNLTVTDQMNFANNVTIGGTLHTGGNITTGASMTSTTSDDVVTPKGYVDQAIAAALTPPQMWDYEVTNSTSLDTVYYINGDLLLYASEEDGLINYTIKVYGEDLNESGTDMEITQVRLRTRGNTQPLMTADNSWTPNGGGGTASFTIGYTDISALAGGQEDGYVSCSLSFEVAGGGEYNSGLTIRFYLDGENTPPSAATFQDPQPE